MSLLPSQSVPPLGGAGGLEFAQQWRNAVMRQLVDNVSLMSSQAMCAGTPPPQGNKTATEAVLQQRQFGTCPNPTMRAEHIKRLLNNLLPEVCKQHVYLFTHERSEYHMCDLVKWTFYNDQSVKLKVETDWLRDAATARPLIEDFEEWQATAIMICEAGEDEWPRPKPSSGSTSGQMGASSQARAQQLSGLMNAQNSQNSQNLNQAALGNALGQAMGLSGIFK